MSAMMVAAINQNAVRQFDGIGCDGSDLLLGSRASESWLERDHLIKLDTDLDVIGVPRSGL